MAKKYLDENGVRYIWQRFNQKLSDSTYETVIFTAKTNDNVNVTTKVYVYTYTKRDSESAEDSLILTQTYNYTGGELTFQIPVGIKYKIEVDELEGYAVPEPKTYTAVARNIRNINYEYKNYVTLTINISFPEDLDMNKWGYGANEHIDIAQIWRDGQYEKTIYIEDQNEPNPKTWTYEYPMSGTPFDIKFLKLYHMKCPTNITFTLKYESYTIDATYEYMEPGVKIMDISGNLVDVDSWNDSMGATGVAVITNNVSIVVAPDEWYSKDGSNPWNGNNVSAWGGADKIIDGIMFSEPGDYDADFPDSGAHNNKVSHDPYGYMSFDGSTNTDKIIEQLRGTVDNYAENYTGAPAAEYCKAYSCGYKGVGEWYLPSYRETEEIYYNFSEVNTALNKIGAASLVKSNQYYLYFKPNSSTSELRNCICTSNQFYALDENDNMAVNQAYVQTYCHLNWDYGTTPSTKIYGPYSDRAVNKYNPFNVRPVCHI